VCERKGKGEAAGRKGEEDIGKAARHCAGGKGRARRPGSMKGEAAGV
jgi:hypothetical protein